MDQSLAAMDVSVVVPVLNERENLVPLFDELVSAFASLPGVCWEVLFVDDGSSDGSRDVIKGLSESQPQLVRVVELRRNYGQTAALDAGIRHSTGSVLVFLDADGQNDPADVPRLLSEIAKGADVVSGWRRRRQDPFLTRRVPSWVANKLIAWSTKVPIRDFGCTLKAYRREALANVRLYGEMHRFIPAYASWNGAKVAEIEVNHRPRKWGTSKYHLLRTYKVLLDLITVLFLQTGYATRPLHLFGLAGLGMTTTAFALAGYVVWEKFSYPLDDPRHIFVHRNPLSSLAALMVIMGAGAVALGLIAELLARTYHASAGPPYAVAGARNLPGLPTPEEARKLPDSLRDLGGEAPPTQTSGDSSATSV